MGAAPLARAKRARKLLGRVGGRGSRGVGSAGCRASPRSPTASARSSARRPGSVFLGPNVSVLQAAIATCIDFPRRAQRSRLRGAAVSVAHVRLARVGALRRGRRASSPPTTGARFRPSASSRRSPKKRRSPCSRTRTTSPARSPTFARFRRTAAASARCSASTPIKPPASIRTTSPHWDLDLVTGGSHKWLCGGPGCGWIYVKPSLLERISPGGHRLDGARASRSRSSRRRSCTPPRCTASATARRRFRVTSSRSRGTRSLRRVGVARIREHNVRLTDKIAAMALERGLARQLAARARSGEPAGSASISTAPSDACRQLDRAARLRRLPSRLRHSRRPALLHDRRRDRRLLRGARHGAVDVEREPQMIVDHTKIGAAFRRLSLPVAVQMLGDQLLGTVDTIAIGSLGTVALAGATAANTIFIAVAFAIFGFMSGTSIVAAQRIGAGDVEGFARTVRAGALVPRAARSPLLRREPLRVERRDPRAGRRACRAPTPARST